MQLKIPALQTPAQQHPRPEGAHEHTMPLLDMIDELLAEVTEPPSRGGLGTAA